MGIELTFVNRDRGLEIHTGRVFEATPVGGYNEVLGVQLPLAPHAGVVQR